MGDGGSYTLGFLSSTLSICALTPVTQIDNGLDFNFFLIFLIFAIPILDMVIVIFTRIRANKSIFFPDRSHIHHRLLDNGFEHKDAVAIILSISQFLVCTGVAVTIDSFAIPIIFTSTFILLCLIFLKCDKQKLLKFKIVPQSKKI